METCEPLFSLDVMESGHSMREAILDGDFQKVKLAVETGTCSVNETDSYGRTLLHLAACRGHLEIIRLLVESGADFTAVDRHGNTPLHWCGHLGCAEILIQNGADINAINNMGFTPRMLAERRGVSKDTVNFFIHCEDQEKMKLRHIHSRSPVARERVILPSVLHEFYSEMGARNTCLLVLGLLGMSLYAAFILTGYNLGFEEKIPLDELSYKIRL